MSNIFEQISGHSRLDPTVAEVKVDLSGLDKQQALHKLEALVTYCKKSGAESLYVTFPPARPGSGETLFQPIARYFKFEKFNGYILSATPIMTADQAGLFVKFANR